jgi:hypothetical protein
LEDRERKAAQLRAKFEEEPQEKDPDACTIVFRLPGQGERIQRRFFKSEQI